ncbi:MAG TPA: prolipoprotein diacylglyceryl transferase, partial [Gemmatimonadota bacterium]|nr:prolipoprotein diacylglyceryl transferase [Gemmatimonadota bacterium]
LRLPVLGPFTITTFGLMLALAFLAAWTVMRKRLDELGEDSRLAGDMVVAALVGGLVGAKLYYLALHWRLVSSAPGAMLSSRAGLVWYGGFIGGAAAVIILLRRRGLPILRAADVIAPALALGYAIGRVGCFLVGDDYGRPTSSWIGIAFPMGSPPTTAGNLAAGFGAHIPAGTPASAVLKVIPTQPIETVATLVIFVLLWRWRKKAWEAGRLLAAYLVLSGVERFVVEVFRAKDDRFLGPFTTAQAVAAVLVLLGVALWARQLDPGRKARPRVDQGGAAREARVRGEAAAGAAS